MSSSNGARRKRVVPASAGEGKNAPKNANNNAHYDPLQGLDDEDGLLSQQQQQMYRVLLQHQGSLNVKQREIFDKLHRKASKIAKATASAAALATEEAPAHESSPRLFDTKNEPLTKRLCDAGATAVEQQDQRKIRLASSHSGLYPRGGPFPRSKREKRHGAVNRATPPPPTSPPDFDEASLNDEARVASTPNSRISIPGVHEVDADDISIRHQEKGPAPVPADSVPYLHKHHLHRRHTKATLPDGSTAPPTRISYHNTAVPPSSPHDAPSSGPSTTPSTSSDSKRFSPDNLPLKSSSTQSSKHRCPQQRPPMISNDSGETTSIPTTSTKSTFPGQPRSPVSETSATTNHRLSRSSRDSGGRNGAGNDDDHRKTNHHHHHHRHTVHEKHDDVHPHRSLAQATDQTSRQTEDAKADGIMSRVVDTKPPPIAETRGVDTVEGGDKKPPVAQPPLPKLKLSIKKLNTSPIHIVDVEATGRQVVEGALASSKADNFYDLPKLCLTIDGVPPPREYPAPTVPGSREKLNPPTPSVTVTTRKEALSSALYNVCVGQPITVIRGYASALKLDLGLFSTRTLVEVDSDHPVEVRTQRQQKSDENWDTLGLIKVWLCESSRSHTSVARYAQYQANSFQESLLDAAKTPAKTPTKGAPSPLLPDVPRMPSKLVSALKEIQSTVTSPKGETGAAFAPNAVTPDPGAPGADFKMIKFGTNVDLSDEKKWRPQLKELQKLPQFFRVVSPCNMLSHVGHTILGMNSVQLYMKVPGARTPGHQENNNFCSVNLNIGPGDCEWFAVDEPFWGLVHDLCAKHGVNYLVGSWWPILEELFELGIPVYRFLQSPGDVVWLSPGTIHWVQAVGWCNNIAWNVGPLSLYQYRVAMERYEFNKYYQVKSIVPMLQLSWHLAKNLKISDRALWVAIRSVLQRSLRHIILTVELVKKIKGVTSTAEAIKWQGREEGEAAYYCTNCEAEVFDILFAKEDQQLKKYVVHCFDCARKSSPTLDRFVILNQFSVDQLCAIYDEFLLTDPSAAPMLVASGSITSRGSAGVSQTTAGLPTSHLPDTPSPSSSSSSSSSSSTTTMTTSQTHPEAAYHGLVKPCSIKLEPAKPSSKYDHSRKSHGLTKFDEDI